MVVDIFALIDIALVVLSATIARTLYIALFLETEALHQPYLVAGLAGGVLTHYLARMRGLYEASAINDWPKRIGELLVTIGLSFLVLIAIAYLLKISSSYSRGWLLTWLLLSTFLLVACRPMYAYLLSSLAAWGFTARRLAIVAGGEAGEQLAQHMRAESGIRLAGVFSDVDTQASVIPVNNISDLISMGQRNEIDEVVIALSDAPGERIEELISELSVLPVDVWLCPAQIRLPVLDTARLGTLNLLQIKPKPIREWGSLLKLCFDYVAGGISLVLFAPLMVVVAVAIKLDSPGPVFFRQRRHGFNHRVIPVYKFRTMRVAQDGPQVEQATKDTRG